MKYLDKVRQYYYRKNASSQFNADGENIDRVASKRDYSSSQKRQYRVYLPVGYQQDRPLPLVMVLHGCLQTHLDIQEVSAFDSVADRHQFIVVYPYVTRYSGIRVRNCWGWWSREHIHRGGGEVEDLWQIIEEVCSEFSVNRRRIHIAGLSSGACMTAAALTVHTGRFASGAVVAGVAYGETPRAVNLPFGMKSRYRSIQKTHAMMAAARDNNREPLPLMIVHSHNDNTVPMKAAENLRDSWLSYFYGEKTWHEKHSHHQTYGISWTHSGYGNYLRRNLVETLFLEGPDHGWYGGRPGDYSFPDAPPISEMMWHFFKRHKAPKAATVDIAGG